MLRISQSDADDLYTRGNSQGLGYAPYTDVVTDDSVASAVDAAKGDGWATVLSPDNTSEVVVLENGDGELMAIGGDGAGRGAWAVIISEVKPA